MKTITSAALLIAGAFFSCGPAPEANPVGFARRLGGDGASLGPVYSVGPGWAVFLEEYNGKSYYVTRDSRLGRISPAVPLYYEEADCTGKAFIATNYFEAPVPTAGTLVAGEDTKTVQYFGYILASDKEFADYLVAKPSVRSTRKANPPFVNDLCEPFDSAATPFPRETALQEVLRVPIQILGAFTVSREP